MRYFMSIQKWNVDAIVVISRAEIEAMILNAMKIKSNYILVIIANYLLT